MGDPSSHQMPRRYKCPYLGSQSFPHMRTCQVVISRRSPDNQSLLESHWPGLNAHGDSYSEGCPPGTCV
jgi:hypothetical protein